MNNYFRITGYHPREDLTAIFDSNGKYDALWKFSAFLVSKGFQIIKVSREENFLEGDMLKGDNVPTRQIRIRACDKGKPVINGNTITVRGKSYEVIE